MTRDVEAGVRVESQTPGNRDVSRSANEGDLLTADDSQLADLPFYGESVTFESRKDMLQRIWEEDRRLQELDKLLRGEAKEAVWSRQEERRRMVAMDKERMQAVWSERRKRLEGRVRVARRRERELADKGRFRFASWRGRRRPVKVKCFREVLDGKKQCESATRVDSMGGSSAPPSREVPASCSVIPEHTVDPSKNFTQDAFTSPVCVVQEEADFHGTPVDVIPEALDTDTLGPDLFTRNAGLDGAFQKARVDEILRLVQFGNHLSEDQLKRAKDLISEYADCFALSVGEVRQVKGAVHKLNIPDGASFKRKVHQRPLTQPQKQYLHTKIDELLASDIIEQCDPSEVKCVSPTRLAKKAHEGGGLALEELQHRLNDQCIAAGLPPCFDLPPRSVEANGVQLEEGATGEKPPKWRICQNFGEVNKLTEIAPMPQGDIRAKQLALSGHKYLCFFDFASGFYCVDMHP
ncbi:hypothetical protein F5878DRAFT_668039, partial [Lentinula raphanica]